MDGCSSPSAAQKQEFPLAWEFSGGSALAGETSREAASRELREETGLELDALELVGRFAEASALLDFYVTSIEVPGMELVLQVSEVAAAEWVTVAEVERRPNAGMMAAPWTARLDALRPWSVG
ncbi:NUDIX domain-containing protein [Agromyces sp. NPDC127015]|uniref:NUDIX domain-containing protein n=1 Tax=Agromyces sp. NPDC127015 TaxID=3347108 RepID=UPI0036486159